VAAKIAPWRADFCTSNKIISGTDGPSNRLRICANQIGKQVPRSFDSTTEWDPASGHHQDQRPSYAAPVGRTDDRTLPDPIINSIYPLQRRGHPQMTAPRGAKCHDIRARRTVLPQSRGSAASSRWGGIRNWARTSMSPCVSPSAHRPRPFAPGVEASRSLPARIERQTPSTGQEPVWPRASRLRHATATCQPAK
jgi:hypothetical protein